MPCQLSLYANGITFRYVRYFSKAANRWGFKIAKEKKLYSYIPDLIYQILSQFSTCYKERPLYTEGIIQEDDPRRLAETIAPTEPVSTKELVSQRHSRLKTSWPQSGKSKENESSEESFAGEEDNKNSQFEIRNNDDDYDDRDDNDDAI